MDIFVSWSGERSKAVAELLVDWVQGVLQMTKPWISTRDIDKGSLWFNEINSRLKVTSAGIICLTQENKNNPWILFESGALAKGISANRICTFLVDLKPTDIRDPLAQFNHTSPDREGMFSLVRTLNRSLGENSLSDATLKRAFEAYWPQFSVEFKNVLDKHQPKVEVAPRPENDMLAEVLEITRSLSSRLSNVESLNASAQSSVVPQSHRPGFSIELFKLAQAMVSSGISYGKVVEELGAQGYSMGAIDAALDAVFSSADLNGSNLRRGVLKGSRNRKNEDGSNGG